MCLLSYHPPGVPVDERHLRNGLEVNDEGAGYAIATDTDDCLMVSNRSLNGEAMLREYLHLRKAAGTHCTHGVFHARLSTGTATTLDNCHPFEVGGDPEVLLFHNGSLYPVPATEPRCDSRIYADDKLMINAELDSAICFGAADDYISSTGSKVLVITSSPAYAETVYVFNRSQWLVTPDGAMHSNSDYLGKGVGWDERWEGGSLYRWRALQPGQCPVDGRYHPDPAVHSGPVLEKYGKPAYHNETERRAKVAALDRREMIMAGDKGDKGSKGGAHEKGRGGGKHAAPGRGGKGGMPSDTATGGKAPAKGDKGGKGGKGR